MPKPSFKRTRGDQDHQEPEELLQPREIRSEHPPQAQQEGPATHSETFRFFLFQVPSVPRLRAA